MTGEGGGGQPLHRRIEKVITKHGIGSGKKARKSKIDPKSKKQTKFSRRKPRSPFPFFIKLVNLKPNKITGEVPIPAQFRNVVLPKHFPGYRYQSKHFWQIKMTNTRTGISGTHPCRINMKDRIPFTKHISNYLKFKEDDKIKFEFQYHIPSNQIGRVAPVKFITRYKISNNSRTLLVSIPKNIKNLTGLEPSKSKYVHWETKGYQGVGRSYTNKNIGISPTSIGIEVKPQEFYDQFTILNPHLTSQQANQMTDLVRAEFVKNELHPIQLETGISFTGIPQEDKPKLLEYSTTDYVKDGLFDNVKSIDYDYRIQLHNGTVIPNKYFKPDGILTRHGTDQKELVENKAYADHGTLKSKDAIDQLSDYHDSGYRVNLITTLSRKDIPKEILRIPDSVYAYEDLSKMADASENPINRQILDLIRKPWPYIRKTEFVKQTK